MTGADRRHRWLPSTAGLLLLLGGACGGTGSLQVATVAAPPVADEKPPTTGQCSVPGMGYTLTYPSGWYTVDRGPVPCRFFHPEPFRLPERTEASWIAVNVQLAPVAFDEIVPSEGDRLGARSLTREEIDLSGRRAVRTISVSSGAGLLPGGLRAVTWYVDAGDATLVGTTSEAAAAGTFDHNVEALDEIVTSAVFSRAEASPPGGDAR